MKIVRLLLFNFITKGYLKQSGRWPFLNRRFKSMVSDMFFCMSIWIPFFVPIFFLLSFFDARGFGKHFSAVNLISTGVMSLIFFTIVNKDFYRAKSVAKRINGYQILDVKTGLPADSLRCMLRNVTCFIWPVEAIMILVSPTRRLGDRIAGTKVTDIAPEIPESILDDIADATNYKDLKRTVIISVLVVAGLMLIASYPEFLAPAKRF